MSDFVPNNRHLRKVLISFFIRRKRRLKRIESSKKFSEMLLWVKQRAVIGSAASKTVISILTTVRVKEGQKPSKTLMLFIMSSWNRTKLSLGNGIERNWYVWAENCAKNGHNTSRGTKKWFYSMTTLGPTLPNPLKLTRKRSNGKSYPIRRIPQILYRPIITCSGRWHMIWLISSSAHVKALKNGLIRG